jgi:hypothetical protein
VGRGVALEPDRLNRRHPPDGAVIGWAIGALITYGRMNNFIVTLAMLLILRGAMLRFTEGNAVNGLNFPPAQVFYSLGSAPAATLPWIGKIPGRGRRHAPSLRDRFRHPRTPPLRA